MDCAAPLYLEPNFMRKARRIGFNRSGYIAKDRMSPNLVAPISANKKKAVTRE